MPDQDVLPPPQAKETAFFHEPDLYSCLRARLLPELIAQARDHQDNLRLWSTGSTTGEEAYVLAMLLADLLGDELERLTVRIFATGLDAEALAYARHGVYLASALQSFPAELVARHVHAVDGAYGINKRVRSLVVFGRHDLRERMPLPRIDLAICHHVLTTFTPDLQQRTLQLFAYSLRDGGYLVLGTADPTTPPPAFFAPAHRRLRIFRRQGAPVLIPPLQIRTSVPTTPLPAPPARRAATSPGGIREPPAMSRGWNTDATLARHVLALPIGVVVVDRHYDIATINNAARRLLGIHSLAIGEDVIHLAQGVPSSPLRAAIDAAFRTAAPARVEDTVTVSTALGEQRAVQIACYPDKPAGAEGPVETVLIMVTDVTEGVHARHQLEQADRHQSEELEQAYARQSAETERLAKRLHQVVDANRALLAANQELTAANTDLRCANGEFLATSAEAQAASEEAETLNAELRATNEEMEMVNAELQATVEELNMANEELEARSVELQDLARSLDAQRRASDAERARLVTILASMDDAVLVVDRAGRPVLTNTAYERMFGCPDADFAPEDERGQALPPEDTPQRRALRGQPFNMPFTLTAADGTRRWFEAHGQPIHGGGQEFAVIIIRDITERSLRRLQDEFLALASHELRTPLTPLHGYLEMLVRARAPTADERTHRYAAQALVQARRLHTLVNDLLDVARLQTGKLSLNLEPLDLVPLVAQAVEAAQFLTASQAIRLDAAPAPIVVRGDAGRLEQVLLNLLTNAIHYAPGTDRVDVRLRRTGGEAELQVQDYGPGIAAEDIPNLFTRFYQVARAREEARSGLGLGLYIAKELVTAHQGRIDVCSVPGQGTTFTVRLPIGDRR